MLTLSQEENKTLNSQIYDFDLSVRENKTSNELVDLVNDEIDIFCGNTKE